MRVLVIDTPARPHAQAGKVLDLPDAEAKDMILRGMAVPAPDVLPAVQAPPPAVRSFTGHGRDTVIVK